MLRMRRLWEYPLEAFGHHTSGSQYTVVGREIHFMLIALELKSPEILFLYYKKFHSIIHL